MPLILLLWLKRLDNVRRRLHRRSVIRAIVKATMKATERKARVVRRRKRNIEFVTPLAHARLMLTTYMTHLQKKNLQSEYYDLNDPFIDDSDLAVDERTFFAQTKQQGFYVSSGEVALLKDKYTCTLSYTFFASTADNPLQIAEEAQVPQTSHRDDHPSRWLTDHEHVQTARVGVGCTPKYTTWSERGNARITYRVAFRRRRWG